MRTRLVRSGSLPGRRQSVCRLPGPDSRATFPVAARASALKGTPGAGIFRRAQDKTYTQRLRAHTHQMDIGKPGDIRHHFTDFR